MASNTGAPVGQVPAGYFPGVQTPGAQKSKGKGTLIGPIFQVQDMTAGVNLRPSPTNIKPSQSTLLQNARISAIGQLGIYPGWKAFSTTNLGSRTAQGGKRIYLTGATFTLVADNGNVYKPSDAGVWGAATLTGISSTNQVDFPYDPTICAAFDGANVPQYTQNGTTWFQQGITAPSGAPSLSAVAGGSLPSGDTIEVSYTYFNATLAQESNESLLATQAVAGGNLSVQVGVTASGDGQVTNIRIYARDVTAGELTRRFVTQVANTTSASAFTITSNVWNGAVPTNVAPPIGQNSVAVAMRFGVIWKNRWWGVDAVVGTRLRFTQVFQNLGWSTNFFVDIPFDRGEAITALITLGDILVVFGTTRFYLILGQTSLDFEVRPALGPQTGAFSFRSVDAIENSIVHASGPGVYLFNGATDTLLTYTIDPAWQSMMSSITAAQVNSFAIAYHKLFKELRVSAPTVYPLNNRGEWILDLNRTNAPVPYGYPPNDQAWFSTDRTVGGYIQWDGNETTPANQGRIFSWNIGTVQLFEERTGTSANGNDLTMQYRGYMLPVGLQWARFIDSYLEYQPDVATSLAVDLIVDGQDQGTVTITPGSGFSKYGSAKYGSSTYGGGATRSVVPIEWPLGAEGHSAQFTLKYIGQGSPLFYSYGHNVIEEPLPRGF